MDHHAAGSVTAARRFRAWFNRPARSRGLLRTVPSMVAGLLSIANATAQEAEPRALRERAGRT